MKTFRTCLGVFWIVCFSVSLLLFSGCDKPEVKKAVSNVSDLNSKEYVIGGETGTRALAVAQKAFPKAHFLEFNAPVDIYAALHGKRVDAMVYDRPTLDYAAQQRPDFAVLPEELAVGRISIGAPFQNKALVEKVNEFIRRYRTDGTYQDMYYRWVMAKNTTMPEIAKASNPTGKIVFGVECANEPMGFLGKDGVLMGFDIEFLQRLALFLNMEYEVKIMDYRALFPACSSGKIDLAVAQMDATPERKETMLFSDQYIDSPISVMVRKDEDSNVPRESGAVASLEDLRGKRAAYMNGGLFQQMTERLMDGIIYYPFNDNNSAVQALRSGKVEAVLLDEPVAKLFASHFPEELQVACVYAEDHYGFAFRKGSPLATQASAVIHELKRTGELDQMIAKWCGEDSAKKQLPRWTHRKDFSGKKGTLRFATDPVMEPMCYVGSQGDYVGLDVEIMSRIAYELDRKLEVIPMNFGGLIEAVNADKADAVGGAMSVTEERKEKVDFAESYYAGGLTILSKKAQTEGGTSGGELKSLGDLAGRKNGLFSGSSFNALTKELAASFERTFVRENRWKLILQGLAVTLLITVLSAFLGTILAFPICMMRRSKHWLGRVIAKSYISLMQGTPILVVLMILYYVIFAKIDVNAVVVAVIGFGLNFSAYVSEMLRTGIDGIPKGQSEAALALGFSRFAVFRNVIFPQAVRSILPVYRGEFINVLKTTSIVGYIAIQDLTKMSDIIRSRTYEAFFPLIATAVIYFAVAWLLASGLTFLEYKLDPNSRRKPLGKGGVK